MNDWSNGLPASCCPELEPNRNCTKEFASQKSCRKSVMDFGDMFNIVYTIVDLLIIVFQVSIGTCVGISFGSEENTNCQRIIAKMLFSLSQLNIYSTDDHDSVDDQFTIEDKVFLS